MKADKTTKRLLSAMMIGVGFSYASGHRYISWHEVGDVLTLKERLEQKQIYPSDKIYGSVMDCLDYIDFLCKLVGWPTLEERFNTYQDWEFGEHYEDEKIWKKYNEPPAWMREN